MKGFIRQTAVALGVGAALFTVLGCTHYRELVDPCWPERYNSMARGSVREMHMAQSAQGHKLDTTVWNIYFQIDRTEKGEDFPTAKLNGAGEEFLRNISRRQPFPDPQLWLQYPHDVKDPARRAQMIADRKASIRMFMNTQTMPGHGDTYQIDVHDHVMPNYPSEWTIKAWNQIDIQGKLQVQTTTGGGGGGGGSGGGGR